MFISIILHQSIPSFGTCSSPIRQLQIATCSSFHPGHCPPSCTTTENTNIAAIFFSYALSHRGTTSFQNGEFVIQSDTKIVIYFLNVVLNKGARILITQKQTNLLSYAVSTVCVAWITCLFVFIPNPTFFITYSKPFPLHLPNVLLSLSPPISRGSNPFHQISRLRATISTYYSGRIPLTIHLLTVALSSCPQ